MGNSESYYYDPCNDMTRKTDRNGNVTTYIYDGMHRVTRTKVTKDGVTQIINNEYGATGGLTKEYDGTSTKSYTYNSLGLVKTDTTIAANREYTLNKTYDYMGNVISVSRSGYGVKYAYDSRGRLTTVSNLDTKTGTYVKLEEYQYDKNNNVLKKISHTAAPDVTYTYNKSNMLATLRQGNLASYDYTYNPDGNVYTVKDNNNNLITVYNYNSNGQVIRELKRNTRTNLNIWYTDYDYDAAGNRTYKNYASPNGDYEIDYVYDKNNRLIKERQYGDAPENNRATSYQYDKNGNRISRRYYIDYPGTAKKITLGIENYRSDLTTDAETYTYDGFNRLTQISTEGDNVYKYAYYPNGLRMYKDLNGTMTYFQWDGDNIWGLSANASNGLTHYYYRGLNGVIKENYGATYVYNGHGDVVKVVDSNGRVTKDYEYDAFGVVDNENATDGNPWRYCGEYYDTETGNIFLRARYYDPSTGSFITEDPARDGVNWYSYCAGNPVNLWDPSGMFDEDTRLKYGDKNADVAVLQSVLRLLGTVEIDDEAGVFGDDTLAAVNAYKEDNSLGNTGENYGVVGVYTWTSLGLSSTYYSAAPKQSLAEDVSLNNCYGFLMNSEEIQTPGGFSGNYPVYRFSADDFMAGVILSMNSDIQVRSKSSDSYVKVVDDSYVPDTSKEYLVMIRYKGNTCLSGVMGNTPDFHFMTQTTDGRWAGKNGTRSLTVVDRGTPTYNDWHFDAPGSKTVLAVVHLEGYDHIG